MLQCICLIAVSLIALVHMTSLSLAQEATTKDGWVIEVSKFSQCVAIGNDDENLFKIEGYTPDQLRFVWALGDGLATELSGENPLPYHTDGSDNPNPKPRDWKGVFLRMTDKRIPGTHDGSEQWDGLQDFGEYSAAGFQILVTPRFLNYFTGAEEIEIISHDDYTEPPRVLRTATLKGSREAMEALFKCFKDQGYNFDGYKYN